MHGDGHSIVGFEQDLLYLRSKVGERVDPVLVVAAEGIVATNDADVVGGVFYRPPLNFGVPELSRRIHAAGLEGAEVTAYYVRGRDRHRREYPAAPTSTPTSAPALRD